MKVTYSRKFEKQLKKAPLEILEALRKRRKLFTEDQFHPQLNNHSLTGKFKGYRSINITGDWRAIYSQTENDEEITIIFEMIGTHSQLYK